MTDIAARSDLAELAELVRPLHGDVYCHCPADARFELVALDRPDDAGDRWSAPGARTAYLAGDPFVALAEFARHAPLGDASAERRVMRLEVAGLRVLDVRDDRVRQLLGGPDHAADYRDRDLARAHSRRLRGARVSQGLLVPSIAFVDDPDRWNLVIFREAVIELAEVLRDPREIGRVSISR